MFKQLIELIRGLMLRIVYKDTLKFPELTVTQTGLPNDIPPKYLPNAQYMIREVISPLRERFPSIRITSFYRSEEVNKAVKGRLGSDHLRAMAIDIVPTEAFATVGKWIRNNLNIRYMKISATCIHISGKDLL